MCVEHVATIGCKYTAHKVCTFRCSADASVARSTPQTPRMGLAPHNMGRPHACDGPNTYGHTVIHVRKRCSWHPPTKATHISASASVLILAEKTKTGPQRPHNLASGVYNNSADAGRRWRVDCCTRWCRERRRCLQSTGTPAFALSRTTGCVLLQDLSQLHPQHREWQRQPHSSPYPRQTTR